MPPEFHQTALPNGLTIIAESDPSAHSAAIGFFVRTGARDERGEVMGVSHFLEHMMFKGTDRLAAADVDRAFDEIGANHNAFTTSELTAFYAHCLPEHLDRAEEVLSEIMRPAIREQDFQDERSVILEEIAMYRDHPFWVLYEQAMEKFYGAHPLSHRVLGTDDTITALSRDQMQAYFDDRYSADNTVVALAGNLDFDHVVGRIDAHCGHWQRTDTARSFPELTVEPADHTMRSSSVNRHYLLLLAPAPAETDDRRYAAGMLASILGEGDGSRLYWALVETGLAEEAQSQYDGRDGTGEYLVYCSCSPANGAEVEAVARRELDALVDSLTDDDLERVRSRVATAATLHGELPGGRMRRLGRVWTYAGAYRSLEDDLARMAAVTLDDLRAVARDFPVTPAVAARLTPEEA